MNDKECTITIDMRLTVTVDIDAWAADFGLTAAEVPADVRSYTVAHLLPDGEINSGVGTITSEVTA